jgi:hypothetical protein
MILRKDYYGLFKVTQVDDSGPPYLTGSCRKTLKIAGMWKQYSDRKLSGFFLVDSCQIPVLSGRNTASTKLPELPGTSSFRIGLFDLGYKRK